MRNAGANRDGRVGASRTTAETTYRRAAYCETREKKWRFVQRTVQGPSAEHKLEDGEEELVDVWVWA